MSERARLPSLVPMKVNPILLRLGRHLRYRELPELVGQRIVARSLAGIEGALRALTQDVIPPSATWLRNMHLEGALAKYGLIDTELAAPRTLLDHPSTLAGIPVLRHTGFLPPHGSRWPDGSDDDLADAGLDALLEDLADDFDPNRVVLKLYLQDDISQDEHARHLMATMRTKGQLALPADYFPRSFTVESACVTNAGFIWFARHFYL